MLAEVSTNLEPAFEHARFEQTMFEQAPVLALPVPLSRAKRRQCGFKGAELIARRALKFYPAEQRVDRCLAFGAHGKPRDIQQGHAANATVGRKQEGEETLGGSAEPGSPRTKRSLFHNKRRPR